MPQKVSRTEILIGFLAVLSIFLVVLGNVMLQKGRFPIGVYTVDLVICGVFALDYIKRLRASESTRRFVKRNWYEPLAMIPAIALHLIAVLPIFSAGLRALRLVRFVRVVLVAVRLRRVFTIADRFVERSRLLYLVVIVSGVVLAAAFAVLAIEFHDPASPIKHISDALWWSLATVTTVGYGDIVPASQLGRSIGMLLMVVGIGVMAVLISQVSATLVESRMARSKQPVETPPETDVGRLQDAVGHIGELSDTELVGLLKEIVTAHGRGRVPEGE